MSAAITTFYPPPSPPPTPAPPEAALTTQERLRLAKRRRAAQLKRWTAREKQQPGSPLSGSPQPDLIAMTTAAAAKGKNKSRQHHVRNQHSHHAGRKGITFVPSVMLLEAAARNDVEEVRRLLELGVSPDSTNEDGLTALHQCCIDDSEEMMKLLLDHGGNPNATDTERWTPLHAAATCGHLHLVKFLIDHDADLLAVNADGNMPYDLCEDDTTLSYIENEMAKRGVTQELIDNTRALTERQMLRDLQQAGGDAFEVRDALGATPLHVAAANGYISVVEYLLDNHVSTESVDNDMWQPIHAAACWGHLEVVEMLAQNGANISAKTKNGETPFDICEDPDIKERLIQLREARVRMGQPKVRRSHSASTRTQSIRRTSLREKMNTTKKDVQDEKLYFMQSFAASEKSSDAKRTARHLTVEGQEEENIDFAGSKPIVDVSDVELNIPPDYLQDEIRSNEDEKPVRPPRNRPEGNAVSVSHSPGSPEKPINIHVSVTINAPPGGGSSSSTSPPPQQQQHSVSNSSTSLPGLAGGASPSAGTTLADLKKARSMSRNISSSSQQSSSSSHRSNKTSPNINQKSSHFSSSPDPTATSIKPHPAPPPPLPPHSTRPPAPLPEKTGGGKSSSGRRRNPSKKSKKGDDKTAAASSSSSSHSAGHNNGSDVPRFTSNNEVVGPPPKKSGCCHIM